MNRSSVSILIVVLSISFLTSTAFAGNSPDVIKASKHDTSPAFSQLATTPSNNTAGANAETNTARPTSSSLLNNPNSDPVASTFTGPLTTATAGTDFEGQSAADTRALLGVAFVPPDTNAAIGNKQIVQMVNVTISVYDKSGNRELGPALIHTLWTGFGGLCENGGGGPNFTDGGDPVVLFDHFANRWLVSQLQYNSSFTRTAQCVAISTSSDATGSYNRYVFDFGSDFPDYPKYGVWTDAYYNSVNIFPGHGFAGARACAMDRNNMLLGNDASIVCIRQPSSVSSLLPADIDGSALPPTSSPEYYVGLADASDLYLFQFHVDFTNPNNSKMTSTLVPVAEFTEICARAVSLACIPEPPPGEYVDGLGDRVMFRLAYRNFGDHESLVVNHTVKGGALAGVRWYEIRSPFSNPFVFQQGTLIDPNTDYWLGSIAMDKLGDIALGFSASSKDLFPSIYVGGRVPSDPKGTLSGPLIITSGSGAQFQSFKRWGDYSSMSVDPADDCTFWYANEYYQTTSSFNWNTHIGSFKFNTCKKGQ